DSFFGMPLAGVGLKLPAAVTGRRSAAEVDVRLCARLAARIQTFAIVVAHARGAPRRVPLADIPGVITGRLEHLGQEGNIFVQLKFADGAVPKSRAAGEQLGSAGKAERVGASRPREGRAAADQLVEAGRLDVPVAEGPDRIGALVVGDEQQDVWTPGRGGR